MTKKILVSGASGIVGYGILRSLKGLDYYLIGTTIYETSAADCFSDLVLHPPLTTDENYISWLIETIKKHKIDMIIPAIEADMSCWNKNRSDLEKTQACVLLNNSSLIELCLDKWNFFEKLKENNFEYAIESSLEADFNQFSLPFIIKPRCGFGSKGIVRVDNKKTFEKYQDKIGKELMVQEYVGSDNEEYTVSGFFSKESKLKAFIVMKRKLSKQGYTELAQVVCEPELKDIINKLAKIFKPIGATNFQFRKHFGKWKLLEINPRISSSTSLKTAFGYNECKMSIDYFLNNKDINQPVIKQGSAIRYTEDYIIYDSNNI